MDSAELESAKQQRTNRCDLVWSGTVEERGFNGFFTRTTSSEESILKLLEPKHLEHYYLAVKSFVPS